MNTQAHVTTRALSRVHLFAAIAAVAVLADAGPASAQSIDDRTIVVPTADLDLTSPTGVVALNARIERAAYEVCDRRGPLDLRPAAAVEQCARRVANAHRREVREVIVAATNAGWRRYLAKAGRTPMAG